MRQFMDDRREQWSALRRHGLSALDACAPVVPPAAPDHAVAVRRSPPKGRRTRRRPLSPYRRNAARTGRGHCGRQHIQRRSRPCCWNRAGPSHPVRARPGVQAFKTWWGRDDDGDQRSRFTVLFIDVQAACRPVRRTIVLHGGDQRDSAADVRVVATRVSSGLLEAVASVIVERRAIRSGRVLSDLGGTSQSFAERTETLEERGQHQGDLRGTVRPNAVDEPSIQEPCGYLHVEEWSLAARGTR